MMNARIQELAAEAKAAVPQGILGVDKWIETYNELFAELIVKECDRVLSEDDGATHHSELLFTHFGVAE